MDKESIIWRESFFKDDFNIDKCLSRYTAKSDLETLRNDLKKYATDLHLQMSEILKTETEAIVNLAEYLTNLSSKIEDLSAPASQLQEEIMSLFELIKATESSYKKIMDNIQYSTYKVDHLRLKYDLIESAKYIENMINLERNYFINDSIILERAVNKYSFEYSYLKTSPISSNVPEIVAVGNHLTELNNKIFLKAIQNNNSQVILRCLRMYDNLGKHSEAEELIQTKIFRSSLHKLFSGHLETTNKNLEEQYQESLNILDEKLFIVLRILEENPELKSFNFILNSFWMEVNKQTKENMPYITAPGNPDLFQMRFKHTCDFLVKLAKKCGNENLIKTNKSFNDYLKRFNLPVYFEIRFQQIASKFESIAVVKPCPTSFFINENPIKANLQITFALWQSLNMCFDSKVFIDNLGDNFLKLFSLLLARYLKWFQESLNDDGHFFSNFLDLENFIMVACADLRLMNYLISCDLSEERFQESIYKIFPSNLRCNLIKILNINVNLINSVSGKLQNHLILLKCDQTIKQLQNVAAIPRLYRKTNRTIPKQPSNYVIEAVEPILKFHHQYSDDFKMINSVIVKITQKYASLVQEVLSSVCKTEESLRRLKSRNVNMVEEVNTKGESISDEAKIREQIKLDTHYFIGKLYHLGLEECRRSMDQLKTTVS